MKKAAGIVGAVVAAGVIAAGALKPAPCLDRKGPGAPVPPCVVEGKCAPTPPPKWCST